LNSSDDGSRDLPQQTVVSPQFASNRTIHLILALSLNPEPIRQIPVVHAIMFVRQNTIQQMQVISDQFKILISFGISAKCIGLTGRTALVIISDDISKYSEISSYHLAFRISFMRMIPFLFGVR
jgi:hypothetical protein